MIVSGHNEIRDAMAHQKSIAFGYLSHRIRFLLSGEYVVPVPALWSSPKPRKRKPAASIHACENAAMASNEELIVSAEELMMEMSFVGLRTCSVILGWLWIFRFGRGRGRDDL